MTKRIVIGVPCWGRSYGKLFRGPVLRSHRAAIDALREAFYGTVKVRYVVQTDDPVGVAKALPRDVEVTLIPAASQMRRNSPMRAMAATHELAIRSADLGDRVVLTNADMLFSVETLIAVERAVRAGKRAVVAACSRTLPGFFGPPAPMRSRDLLAWTMRRIHPINRGCVWGTGKCHLPWGLYFRENGATILRGFHLHPFAVVKDRELKFGGTIDMDLIDNYAPEEVHLVTDADEMALAEMSPREKSLGDNPWLIDVAQVAAWAVRGARPTHWWNFRHRIAIEGDPAAVTSDLSVAEQVLRLCPYPAALAAST